MTDHTLIAELRDLITDWDGADIPDSSLPRVDILCGTIRRAISALENSKAPLADATNDPASSDLSSLRKGAEVGAIMEMFGRWQSGYAFDDDNDDDVDLESRVEGEIAALVSGSREDGDANA